jgi:hypothetical protein
VPGVAGRDRWPLQGFAVSGNFVFMLDLYGNLFKQGATSSIRTELSCQTAGDSQFFLDSDGYLYRFNTAASSVTRFDSTKVKSFDVTTDGYAFMLETNGYLIKQGANSTKRTRFNSALVDSFSIRADIVYMLETKTASNPGYLIRQGSTADTWKRLDYEELGGNLNFIGSDSYLYSFRKSSGSPGIKGLAAT